MSIGRRIFVGGAALAVVAGGGALWLRSLQAPYVAAASRVRAPLPEDAETADLIRFATLAASGHNTQPWLFSLVGDRASIIPDFSRRTPVVDSDDHHLYASLGCAAETLSIVVRARGRGGEVMFEPAGDGKLVVTLADGRSEPSPLFSAIPDRQCTRSDYDGTGLTAGEVSALVAEAEPLGVEAIWIEGAAVEPILDLVIAGNSLQMDNPAFVDELKDWLRFNGAEAARTGDGLYSASSGNPSLPSALGPIVFDLVFRKKAENEKYARQMRSSSGVFVLVGPTDDPAGWSAAGRAYQRMALRATASGLKNAFVNQAVEEPGIRAQLSSHLGLGMRRPNLVFRVGRAEPMPRSLRRPPEEVMI